MAAVGDVVLYGVHNRDVATFQARSPARKCAADWETVALVAGTVLPAVVVAGGPTVVNLQVLHDGPTAFFVQGAQPGAANTPGAYWPRV